MTLAPTLLESLPISRAIVAPEWIDGNDHMNACYYLAIIKEPAIEAHNAWDYGVDFRVRTGESNFVLESHVRHFRELKLGDPLLVSTRIVDLDDKRLHLAFEIHNEREAYLAAVAEYVTIHVRMAPPAARPFPAELRDRLERIKAAHERVPMASEARGRLRLSIHTRPGQ
ncbi:hypothetical protein SLNSH_21715 [Alsobacter soli]|uniref:Thioesterase n=1 Tax=Alsobacter soli TaxID=2109933 RepID=A0A2T1HMQ2_9HYPH|nr:thioesterase family protein [Alsobacter soli]PSC02902.1 hypothetical protein SLNSH_21715 [Alsobacter soli]